VSFKSNSGLFIDTTVSPLLTSAVFVDLPIPLDVPVMATVTIYLFLYQLIS